MEHYDLIVIGNGSAGDNIARTLGRKGVRVATVERQHLGGECLNDGCIPSKALIDVAKKASAAKLTWSEVTARVHATQLLVRGSDPNGGLRGDGVELIWGDARFISPTTLIANGSELTASNIVVATGTEPDLPPIPGLEDARPQTNRTIFHVANQPRRLAVLGAGPVGVELGQAFHRLGSQVTMFDVADRIATTEDHEVSLELRRSLESEGIRVETGITIERVDRRAEMVVVTTDRGCFEVDEILVAAGRNAQIPDGLVDLGLELDRRGFIDISPCGRTNLPGVWAAGDVTGKFLFTHYASYQAHHIGRHLMDGMCVQIPETLVPWAIFTDPEVGHAGMTELQARAAGRNIRVVVLKADELDWFRTTGQTGGFSKVITDAETGVLLGAHFICARASTIVGEACLAIQHGMTARDVASTIHPYPTASELFRWACARLV